MVTGDERFAEDARLRCNGGTDVRNGNASLGEYAPAAIDIDKAWSLTSAHPDESASPASVSGPGSPRTERS